jgi:hypothetical protein
MALRNLATAAFGKGTATTLPASVDDHQTWRQHQRQREELAATLAAAMADVSRFQRERAQADHDAQEAQVRQLLGDEPATVAPDAEARIVTSDAAITTAQARVAAITEAVRRLDARGEQLRNSIQSEMRGAIEASARDVVKKLGKALKDAQGFSDELARLQRYDFVTLPVGHWHELSGANEYSRLNQWLAGVQAAGWDV